MIQGIHSKKSSDSLACKALACFYFLVILHVFSTLSSTKNDYFPLLLKRVILQRNRCDTKLNFVYNDFRVILSIILLE